MHRILIWSPLAEKDFVNILEYLHENWGEKVLENFIEITDESINQIIINPKQFPIIKKKEKIRKCVLTKQNTLFYNFGRQSINILRIYDTRQDPKKLKFV
jgi:plasmid stabilization system protein ParE